MQNCDDVCHLFIDTTHIRIPQNLPSIFASDNYDFHSYFEDEILPAIFRDIRMGMLNDYQLV